MIVDITKLQGITNIIFPSKSKCNKFVRHLRVIHGYTIIGSNHVIQLTGGYVEIDPNLKTITYKTAEVTTVLTSDSFVCYTDLLLETCRNQKSLTYERHQGHTHYLSRPIVGSEGDLELRYYIQFNDRPWLVGKYCIKEKSTKKYLEISDEQAKFVKKTMTTTEWDRTIGFRNKEGFKRVRLTAAGEPISALACAKHPSEDLVRGQTLRVKVNGIKFDVVFSHTVGTRVFVFIDNTSRFISNTVEAQEWALKD